MRRLVLLPGDGVGPELIDAVRTVLAVLEPAAGAGSGGKLEVEELPFGASAYRSEGTALPPATLRAMTEAGAALLGGLDVEQCPPPSPMGVLRRELGLYAEVRLAVAPRLGIDVTLIRDLSEGFLPDRNMWKGQGEYMPSPDVAISTRVITRSGVERLSRFALDYAQANHRRKITLVHKAPVFRLTCGLFRDVARECLAGQTGLEVDEGLVDEVAGLLVADAGRFDIVLATNLFGDILADVMAAKVGGLVPAASYGERVALFKPAHEALPGLSGSGSINPLPAFLALGMALRYLGWETAAARLTAATRRAAVELQAETLELPAGRLTEVTRAVSALIKEGTGPWA